MPINSKEEVANNGDLESLDLEANVTYEDIIEPKIPDDIIFPVELNKFLRDRIRDLTGENGCLRRSLEEAEHEIRNLKKSSASSASALPEIPFSIGKASAMASTKIMELSKKCREQTAEVEVLKTKCKNLEFQLASKEEESTQNALNGARKKIIVNGHDKCLEDQLLAKEEQIKVLNEKLHQINLKLCESRNSCTSLRQEINKAQKLLCSEVGENVTIVSLSNQPGGWRGRAEQIQQLQQRVNELQCKLSEYEGTHKFNGGSFASIVEQRNILNLRSLERERRQQIENSAKELKQAEMALEASKRKLEASKARIKVLENELNSSKRSLDLLNEKRAHDDQLIDALNGQLRAIERRFQDREIDIQNQKDKAERECLALKNELQASHVQVELLRKRLEEKEVEINVLKSATETPRTKNYNQSKNINENNSMLRVYENSLSTCRSSKDPNEYVTLGLAAEAERERLIELVIVLNRRLDKERSEANEITDLLRLERKKTAKLETKLQRLEMERTSLSKIHCGYKTKASKMFLKEQEKLENIEHTRLKVELLEEECLALKTRIATIQQEKNADLLMYKQMLDQARRTFQEAHRGKPPTSSCYSSVTI